MTLLLLGGNGQVGWELRRALAPLGLESDGVERVDLTHPHEMRSRVSALGPRIIVNAAAYTAVDAAEDHAEQAHQINTVAPGILAELARQSDATLLHFSTDYVFDGSGTQARDEEATTGPLNVYGRTKLAGEERIRDSGCRHLILRTSWVHGARGHNFIRTVLRLAAERDQLDVVNDQIGAPTGADLLADVSAHMLRALAADESLAGTYHCTASGEASWYDIARHVITTAQAAGVATRLTPDAIRPVASANYPTRARRPLNSRLDSRKLRHRFGLSMPPWQAGVERTVTEASINLLGG